MDSFRFANPHALYLLALVPVIVALMLFLWHRRKMALRRYGQEHLLARLMPDYSNVRVKAKAWILLLAFILQIVVVARPQFGSKLQTIKRKGIEIMLALDVSNSMNAEDVSPSRLSVAKMAVSRLVDKLGDDKVGLVVFAGNAYVQLPMTADYGAAKMFLQTVSTGMVPTQGTAIGAAIDLCRRSFSPESEANKAIVVITDGENHEDDAVQAAADAASEGIKTYMVGMGTTKGSPIPVEPGKSGKFIKDREGNIVISKINEAALAQIAQAGNGAYVPANNIRNGINSLVDQLEKIEKTEIESKVFSEYEDRHMPLQWIVFALLLIDLAIMPRKNPALAKFDIFTRKKRGNDIFLSEKE